MDPLVVFDQNMNEARFLVELYDTFLTNSERNVRATFLSRSNRFLRPLTQKSFNARSSSKNSYVFFTEDSTLGWRSLRHSKLKSLLRMALVQAVAAMDCYFHDQIEWHFGRILSQNPDGTSKDFENFPLPAGKVKQVIEEYERTTVGLRRIFETQLRKKSIQSVREIESQLKIIGVTGFWGNVANEMGVDCPELKSWIGKIARRRNQIVHEGDRRRLQNGRLSKDRDIDRDAVVDDIHVIDCFVYAMEHEIESRATA